MKRLIRGVQDAVELNPVQLGYLDSELVRFVQTNCLLLLCDSSRKYSALTKHSCTLATKGVRAHCAKLYSVLWPTGD